MPDFVDNLPLTSGLTQPINGGQIGYTLDWASSALSIPPLHTLTRSGTTATYYNSSGVLTTAGADVARFSYNPATLALEGLMVEAAATNLVTDVRDMTTVNWTRGATVTVALTGTGADGAANSCSRVTGGAVAATNRVSQQLVAAASQRVYGPLIKRVTGTGPILITQDGFTTTTDVSSQINSTSFTQVKINGNTLNATYGVQVSTAGDVILVDGNQFETGTDPTSTILTGGTRNADVLTATTSGLLSNTQGFVAASYKVIATPVAGQGSLVSTFNGTEGAPLYLFGGNVYLFDGTGSRVGPSITVNAGTSYSIASTWGGANCAIAANGTVVSGLTFDGSMDLGATIRNGAFVDGANGFSMYLKSLRYSLNTAAPVNLANPF